MVLDPEIDRLRQEIDRVDHEILRLLKERAAVVLDVGDRKRERGFSIYDPARERALLERLAGDAEAPLDLVAVQSVFEAIVTQCRRLEDEHVTEQVAEHGRRG